MPQVVVFLVVVVLVVAVVCCGVGVGVGVVDFIGPAFVTNAVGCVAAV